MAMERILRVLRLSMAALFAVASFAPAFASAPPSGNAIEGVSVPGLTLGASRAEVEKSYGEPDACQSGAHQHDRAICVYTTAEGMIEVSYRSGKGRDPKGNAKDAVAGIGWTGQPEWMTSRGISTANALSNPQGVIDAYPGAAVTRFEDGSPQRLVDGSLGVEVDWKPVGTGDSLSVEIRIFSPKNPPKEPQKP
jgi:hypothetical protein